MKNFKTVILFVCLLGTSLGVKSQTGLDIKTLFIMENGILLNADSIPIYKTDSTELKFFYSFNELVSNIDKIQVQIGDTTDATNLLDEQLSISVVSGNQVISGLGMVNRPVNYGNNLIISFHCPTGSNLKWITTYYINSTGGTSNKKYYKIR